MVPLWLAILLVLNLKDTKYEISFSSCIPFQVSVDMITFNPNLNIFALLEFTFTWQVMCELE